jgi:uncharacterized protein
MLLDQLRQQHRTAILAIAARYGASHVRVFGSVARGEERADSDVDFLVELPRGYDMFGQRLPLTDSLESLLQRSVEVIPEHELNPHVRPHVLRDAVAL